MDYYEYVLWRSMFSIEKDASKISLVYLFAHLIEGGFKFIDLNFVESFKTIWDKKIIRNDYKELLLQSKTNKKLFPENISKTYLITLAELFFFKNIGSSNKHSSNLMSYITFRGKLKYCDDLNIQPRNSSLFFCTLG